MKFDFNIDPRPWLPVALLAAALAFGPRPAIADEADLEKQLEALRAEVAQLKAEGAGAARIDELERRLDLLAGEVEKSRTSGASGPTAAPPATVAGFGPAASKVYASPGGVSIGGYGEAVYQDYRQDREDGAPAGSRDTADMLRNVVYVGYKFSDRILLNSELEFEHASTGEGGEEKGEVSVELGYLEFKPWKAVGLRAGLVLIPVGFINELHEAPIFHGVRRPEVEQVIVPSTWREAAVGAFGEHGPIQWRAYVTAGLSSTGFAAEGIREGRQGGSNSLAEDLALTGRLDFNGVPGLLVGASAFSGKSGQGAVVDGRTLEAQVTVADLHLQYERRGLQLRALAARTWVGDAALVNQQNGLAGEESVGERQYGVYLQAAYDVLATRPRGRWSVTPFVRWERLDPQERVPAGYERNPGLDETIWTAGVGVKPIPNVVLKTDYQWVSNRAQTGVSQWNLGIGYLF